MAETNINPPQGVRAHDFVALPAGVAVGRYTIRKVLGQGSFGITYLAFDEQLQHNIALKEYLPTAFAIRHDGLMVLPSSTRSSGDFAWGRQRFIEEARTLAGFRRVSGIVHVYDFLEANGTAYMIMEVVEGVTLEQKLEKDGPLTAAAVDRILRPLLDGLTRVHEAGFVHRDIKPANILLDGDGSPTLIDFGAARAAIASRTAAMTAVFTPSYAALEQFTEGRQGPWTDIYALAATLYHAISGRKPLSAIDRTLEDRYEPLAKLKLSGYPMKLLAGIDRGLAMRPTDRPQTIGEWRRSLVPVAAQPAVLPRRNSRAALYGGAAILAVAIAATSFLLFAPARRTDALSGAKSPLLEQASAAEQAMRAEAERAERERAERERRTAEAERLAREQADADAARLKSVEDEAKRRDENARLQAEANRQRAEQESRAAVQAEQEAARKKAEAEVAARAAEDTRRRAEEEAVFRKAAAEATARATEDAHRQPEADQQRVDEARLQADAERAARQRTEEEAAKRRAEDEVAARKAAEAAEVALKLGATDLQRIQQMLSAQGFDTRGADGIFGPRSRQMLTNWQKSRSFPATGFLTAVQAKDLLDAAAKRQAEEEARRQFYLGYAYDTGRGVPTDYAQAAAWYRKAADQGLPEAQYNLGRMYEKGQGVPLDPAQAAAWYRKAADEGFPEAQNILGVMYISGRGVPQDDAQAAAWYRRAADQDYAVAQDNLGYMYETGRGVSRDYAQAAAWYRKAADQGNAGAQKGLEELYSKGLVSKDTGSKR